MARYAYIVGQTGPDDGPLEKLSFVNNDVTKIVDVFGKPPAEYEIKSAKDSDSWIESLRSFEELASNCKHEDTLLFYFSGHGVYQRGRLYLIWNDTDLSSLVSTSLPISLIKTIFANSKAKVRIMILDCCHSGAAGEKMFTKGSRRRDFDEPLFEAAQESASVILTACGKNATTREVEELESGYLTDLLTKALSEKHFSEVDRDKDGLISVHELIGWFSDETAKFNLKRGKNDQIDSPELYGDFRGDVYLTSHRVYVDDELNQSLKKLVHDSVKKIEQKFDESNKLDFTTLKSLASPLRKAAPTFTNLDIFDELFKKSNDASIFAAAVMLQVRRDPNYMEKLISYIDDPRFRGAAIWRILRAVRDTLPSYKLSEKGKSDLVSRLKKANSYWEERGKIFARGTIPEMIRQVCRRINIPYDDVFSKRQLRAL